MEVLGGIIGFAFCVGFIGLMFWLGGKLGRKASAPITNRIVATNEARSTDLHISTALPARELVERIAAAVPLRPASAFKNGLELQSKSDMGLIYRSVTTVGGTSWRLRIDVAEGDTTVLHAYLGDMQTITNSMGMTKTSSSQEAVSIFETIRHVVQSADSSAQVHG